jgi:2-phospho-L-lactate guanylyltransferase
MNAAVVMPVRAFASGKSRLGGLLDGPARSELLRSMAERVAAAAGPLPVAVVSSAREVRAWAASRGLVLLDDPGSLDAAAAAGVRWAAGLGVLRVMVAHADLPLAVSLAPLARDAGRPIVAAVPCHHDDGTPVLSLPTACPFQFAYGPGSFRRHAAEAARRGLGFRVVRDPSLAHDVDTAEDLAGLDLAPRRQRPEWERHRAVV